MGLLHARLAKYDLPQKMIEKGIYPYFRQITSKQGTEVTMDGKQILMFGSNAYTGLTGGRYRGTQKIRLWLRRFTFS